MIHTVQTRILYVQSQDTGGCACNRQCCQKYTGLITCLILNFQSLWCSKILSCCQVSHDSKTQLCDPSIWGHGPEFKKLGSRQMQAPGWDLVLFDLYLWLLSVSTVQEIHPLIQTFNPLLSSAPLDEWTTHASILLQTCLSRLLFCFIMWLIQFSLH